MTNFNFKDTLKQHLKAGVKAIYIESSEWYRLRGVINRSSKDEGKSAWFWNSVNGFTDVNSDPVVKENGSPVFNKNKDEDEDNPTDFMEMLDYIREKKKEKNRVYVLEFADLHMDNSKQPSMHFAVTLRALQTQPINLSESRHIIVLAPTLNIPDFLKKEFSVLDFPLPERDEIRTLLQDVEEEFELKSVDYSSEILDSVRGLGTTEIRNAFAKVAALDNKVIGAEQISDLTAEKEQIIRKTGYLNFIRTDIGMDFIGGLEKLREWLKDRKKIFGEKARNAKINPPKGVLLTGIPGTGKSMCAKAAAVEWEIPLLRLDMGSIYSSGVGDSEANMRNAIKVAESLAPCVLWIDEIEKGLSGGASQSGELDGGTSMRVFGSLLTWMQEKEKEVFVFATANNIGKLPPEFLRKGRFDEIFFVDLPGKEARKDIFRNHLDKKEQENVGISDELINRTKGFSGAEIETIVNDALLMSYNSDNGSAKITAENLINAVGYEDEEGKFALKIVPLSSTMPEIEKLRKLAKNRFRPAAKKVDSKENSPEVASECLPKEKTNLFA